MIEEVPTFFVRAFIPMIENMFRSESNETCKPIKFRQQMGGELKMIKQLRQCAFEIL